jgi:hypothetical protein
MGRHFNNEGKEHRMKIKTWQVLLPIIGIIAIKLAVIGGITVVAIHFIRKNW